MKLKFHLRFWQRRINFDNLNISDDISEIPNNTDLIISNSRGSARYWIFIFYVGTLPTPIYLPIPYSYNINIKLIFYRSEKISNYVQEVFSRVYSWQKSILPLYKRFIHQISGLPTQKNIMVETQCEHCSVCCFSFRYGCKRDRRRDGEAAVRHESPSGRRPGSSSNLVQRRHLFSYLQVSKVFN